MSAREVLTCPTCHHQSTAYYKRLNLGHIDALIKLRKAVGHHHRNDIHIYRDMDGRDFELTAAQKMNFPLLRLYGLVARVKEGGEVKRGHWLVTKRGGMFLAGELSVPHKIKVHQNRKVDETPMRLTIKHIRRSLDLPYFDDKADLIIERLPLSIEGDDA